MTTNIKFGWLNYVVSGALTATSQQTGYEVTKLTGPTASPGWRTAATVTGASFALDAGSAVPWDVVALFRANLSATATVQVLLGSTPGGSDVYAGAAVNAGVAPGYLQSLTLLPSTKTARYLTVQILDSANPDGVLKVGLAYAGPLWTPSRNFTYGLANGWQDDSTFQVSKGGQEYAVVQPEYRQATFKIENLLQSEVWADVAEIDRLQGVTQNVLVIPNPSSANLAQEAIFGRIAKSDAPVVTAYNRFTKNYVVRERL